jgi:hypothetical protein
MTETENRIVRLIAVHSREDAIHAHEIAAELGWRRSREREVRKIVSRLDDEGQFPFILGRAPGKGFWQLDDYDAAVQVRDWITGEVRRANRRLFVFDRNTRRLGIYIHDGDARTEAQLLASLVNGQGNMSDRSYARVLGTSHTTWRAIKAGTYRGNTANLLRKLTHNKG